MIIKRDKYLDLARELKMQWDMKMMVMPIIVGVLGTNPKELVKKLEDLEISWQVDIFQTIVIIRSDRILRRALET